MNKQNHLQKIADALIQLTRKYHNPKMNILTELMSNLLEVSTLIGAEGVRMKQEEIERVRREQESK